MYWATNAFVALSILLALLSGGSTVLFIISIICGLGSVITMYIDLKRIEKEIYGIAPILWLFGGLFMYIGFMPLYIYKRPMVT